MNGISRPSSPLLSLVIRHGARIAKKRKRLRHYTYTRESPGHPAHTRAYVHIYEGYRSACATRTFTCAITLVYYERYYDEYYHRSVPWGWVSWTLWTVGRSSIIPRYWKVIEKTSATCMLRRLIAHKCDTKNVSQCIWICDNIIKASKSCITSVDF